MLRAYLAKWKAEIGTFFEGVGPDSNRSSRSPPRLRIADAITAFAGSMRFVYMHAVIFAAWMLFFERSPWPTLT